MKTISKSVVSGKTISRYDSDARFTEIINDIFGNGYEIVSIKQFEKCIVVEIMPQGYIK